MPAPLRHTLDPATRQIVDYLEERVSALSARIASLEEQITKTGQQATSAVAKLDSQMTGVSQRVAGVERSASGAGETLTKAKLDESLSRGVETVLAGMSKEYRVHVNTDEFPGSVVFNHKDTKYGGTTGAYSGSLRSALVINSNGIAAGANRKSDGVWQNGFAIDSNGNATFAGALSAATGSFAGSLSAATGSFGAVTVGSTMEVNSSGSIYSTGKTSYSDTDAGFWLGYDSGAYKFNIGDSTKYMKWDGSSLTFAGDVNTAGKITATGSFATGNALGDAAIYGNPSGSLDNGVFGRSSGGNGVVGYASGSGAVGVCGAMYPSASAGTIGVKAAATGSGTALAVEGKMTINNSNLVANMYTQYASDAYILHSANWTNYIQPASTQYWTGGGTATWVGTNKPGGSTSNIWLGLMVNGTEYFIPIWSA